MEVNGEAVFGVVEGCKLRWEVEVAEATTKGG